MVDSANKGGTLYKKQRGSKREGASYKKKIEEEKAANAVAKAAGIGDAKPKKRAYRQRKQLEVIDNKASSNNNKPLAKKSKKLKTDPSTSYYKPDSRVTLIYPEQEIEEHCQILKQKIRGLYPLVDKGIFMI